MDWPFTLQRVLAQQPCVLVTLNLILGSAPRESGSRMIVTAEAVHGSIGGGNLEFTAIGRARELLAASSEARQLHQPFGLGPALNQCCGGAVTVLFEVLPGSEPPWLGQLLAALEARQPAVLATAIDRPSPLHVVLRNGEPAPTDVPAETWEACRALLIKVKKGSDPFSTTPALDSASPARSEKGSDPFFEATPLPAVELDGDTWWLEPVRPHSVPLYLFGAGHVGREVARLLERLPFDVTWIDSREDAFDDTPGHGTRLVRTNQPAAEVQGAPNGSVFVVMTHSHQLDEDICFEVLQRGDFAWLGLIGSATKRRRFEQRLGKRGIETSCVARLVCPIGLDGIRGKQPATIALSLIAQLMLEWPYLREI